MNSEIPALNELRVLLQRPIIRLLALSSMLSAIVVISLDSRTAVRDPDNWWHLRVGQWIVENHAFPHVGIFSRTAATRPWRAYSWGYEILLSRSYDWFGILGMAVFGLLLTLLVAAVFYFSLYRLSRSFWTAWFLCAVGAYGFLFKLLPRPVFFSMALFSVVVTLILEAHRENNIRLLYPLPLVFVLWANLHIQFIYGLFALGLFFAVTCLERLPAIRELAADRFVTNSLPLSKLLSMVVICAGACCVGPYGYHLFEVILGYSRSTLPYTFVQELQAPEFRMPPDYVLLLLVGAGYFALGSQKKVDAFKVVLLVVASVFSFRSSRDVWFAGICAALFIADWAFQDGSEKGESSPSPRPRLWEFAASGVVLAILTILIAPRMGLTTRALDHTISANFPVDAVNYLRRNPAPGPLYNDFNWGGFLIWYMPDFPVSIDARADLYGDEANGVALRSLGGDYLADRNLNQAGFVIANKAMPLPWKLASDPRFHIVYQDQLAAVFVRNH